MLLSRFHHELQFTRGRPDAHSSETKVLHPVGGWVRSHTSSEGLLSPRVLSWDFPGCPEAKNLHANARDTSSIPGLERLHMHRGKEACAPKLLSLCSRAHVLQLLKPGSPSACAPQQEKPPQWEAHALQLASSPHLQLEKARKWRWRSSTAKNTYIHNFKKIPSVCFLLNKPLLGFETELEQNGEVTQ